MEDIELVIKMDEKYYGIIKEQIKNEDNHNPLVVIIANGIPIDKYEPFITMSKAFTNSLTHVKILEDENEELKDKINKILAIIEANKESKE